jgi:hypothetical protein
VAWERPDGTGQIQAGKASRIDILDTRLRPVKLRGARRILGVSGIRPVAMNAVLRRNGLCRVSDWIEKEKQGDQEEGETQPEARAPVA